MPPLIGPRSGASVLLLAGCLALVRPGWTKEPEAATPTREQVARLVLGLDAEERAEREQAEKELVDLGPGVLAFLPATDDPDLSAEQRQRLRRLVPALWQARLALDVAGSRVTLGSGTLQEILERIGSRSGNSLTDLRADFNQEVTNPTLELGNEPDLFWKSLDALGDAAGISLYAHAGDRKLGIVGRPRSPSPIAYAGAFRFEVQKILIERDLTQLDDPPACALLLDGLVEPRLQPLAVEVDAAKIQATDDKGRKLAPLSPESYPILIDSTSFQFPLQFRVAAPARDAARIDLAAELAVTLPSHVDEVVFDKLDGRRPSERTTAGLRAELGVITSEDGVWSVPLSIQYLVSAGDFESHLQASMRNELYLEAADGSRFAQNGGMNSLPAEGAEFRAEYLFVDAPGKLTDYRLVVRVPSGLTQVPVRFAFKDLPLP